MPSTLELSTLPIRFALDGLVFANAHIAVSQPLARSKHRSWAGVALTVALFSLYTASVRPLLIQETLYGAAPVIVCLAAMLFFWPALLANDRPHALRSLREMGGDIAPDINREMIVNVRVYGLVILGVVSPYVIGHWQWPFSLRSEILDQIFATVLDAGNLQVASIAFVIWAARRHYIRWRVPSGTVRTSPKLGFVTAFLFLTALMLLATLVNDWMIRPNFQTVVLPRNGLAESPLTTYVVNQLHLAPDHRSPSGFVIRQTVLFLIFSLLTRQKGWRDVFPSSSTLLKSANWVLLSAVVMSRMYVAAATPREVGVAIAVGLVLFWYVVPTVIFLLRRSLEHYETLAAPVPILTFGYTVVLWWVCSLKWEFLVGMGTVYLLNALFRISCDTKLVSEFGSPPHRSILGLT